MVLLQPLVALIAVLALIVICAQVARRLPFLQRSIAMASGNSGKPVQQCHVLDARHTLRIIRYQGKEYRVLHSGAAMLLLDTQPVGSDITATVVAVEKVS
jgi:hypothetical protein